MAARIQPLLTLLALTALTTAQDQREFFENRIRPVLVEHCYRCHNSSGQRKGGLSLDDREGLRRGGRSGTAIVVGRSRDSLLIRALRHSDAALRMPAEGPKLEPATIADFARWIDDGAYDPRDEPPRAGELETSLSWEETRRRRMKWWSWQPIGDQSPPEVTGRRGEHVVDRFIRARLRAESLEPAPRADRRTLIRRVTSVLTGLPPKTDEIEQFVNDRAPQAYERLVDRLLASPRFGERWARHWMDWMRYADSHGSEGDPAIPHAWRYRDYLIRALNADVPFDDLVREHVAGDLLPQPRINRQLGINESALGVAQYRFVQHGFAPTDALEEQVRFTDNQIDVLTKAFLGLTVSCARCHDHKFDAIGQADFYALYGVLASCRPAMITIDTPERLQQNKQPMKRLKAKIKDGLAQAWLASVDGLPRRLAGPDAPLAEVLGKAAKDSRNPLHAWSRASAATPGMLVGTWADLVDGWERSVERIKKTESANRGWDLTGDDYRKWFRHGTGLNDRPTPAGAFHVLPQGDRVVASILPSGVFTHLISSKHNGVLTSPRFAFDMKSIHVRVMGDGGATARYVVQNYPRGGTVYPIQRLTGGASRWVRWDTTYWRGDHGYLELSTAADQPVEADTGATRSWFGITRVALLSDEQVARGELPEDEEAEFVGPLFEMAKTRAPSSLTGLADLYVSTLRACIESWAADRLSDDGARFLSFFVGHDLLPTRMAELPKVAALVDAYRKLDEGVPVPTRAPGIVEAEPFDQPLFIRGDHRKPADRVPRRFLVAIDDTPYRSGDSGRLALARDLVRPDNPLTPRVAVNRLWHHVFGAGIVPSTDNFGRLGDKPAHPALLDYLAKRFMTSGWSMKAMIRLLVMSETFCADHRASPRAAAVDPQNRLLSHASVRRLEAEAVRDAILAVTGRLQLEMYGPAVPGTSLRRSVYVRVKRNDLDPLLSAFDAPEPHTTRGRRDTTNVPTQSLTLLNDPFVRAQAGAWADAVLGNRDLRNDPQRFRHMFLTAFGRPATDAELERCAAFLSALEINARDLERQAARLDDHMKATAAKRAAVFEPVHARLRNQLEHAGGDRPDGPVPVARWEFDHDLQDAIGTLHGTAHGTARLEDGAAVVDGKGHVATSPLPFTLTEKTLEAWVQLTGLDQRGGGVMSVESIGGARFDSIVFGERDPRQWLPGSDYFKRTQRLGGPPEAEAARRPVHLAITYARDGTIRAYRDGAPYGRAYRSNGPMRFEARESIVVFGLRHSPANDGKRLRGRILRASLYDSALTPGEVQASATGDRYFVSRARVLAAMTDAQRRDYLRLGEEIERTRAERAKLGVAEGHVPKPLESWRSFAQCLINFKEFIYIR